MLAPRSYVLPRATRGGHIDSDVLTEDEARRRGNLKGRRGPIPLRLLDDEDLASQERRISGTSRGVRLGWRGQATGVEWIHG
jgi:hypothetical protein